MIESAQEYASGQATLNGFTAIADICTIDVRPYKTIWVQLATTGGNALTGFVVQGRPMNDPNALVPPVFQQIAGAAIDYTTPKAPVVGASGDLTTLANATPGWLKLDLSGLESIKFRASAAVAENIVLSWGINPF